MPSAFRIFVATKRTLRAAIIIALLGLAGAAGFLLSMYFIYLQGWKIKAFCIYCLFSAATSTTIFILTSSFPNDQKFRPKPSRRASRTAFDGMANETPFEPTTVATVTPATFPSYVRSGPPEFPGLMAASV